MSASDIIIAQLRSELAAKQSTIDALIAANADLDMQLNSQLTKAPVNTVHYEKRPFGTKLKWVSAETPNIYRVAIVDKNHNVIQVKSMTNNGAEMDPNPHPLYGPSLKKTQFDDEVAWRASLPQGEVTVTPFMTTMQKKNQPLNKEIADPLKLKEVMQRFKVQCNVYTDFSNNQRLIDSRNMLLANSVNRPHDVPWMTRTVEHFERMCATHTEEENNYERPRMRDYGFKQRLYIAVGDVIKEIAYELYKGTHYIVDREGNRYKTFAELGDCLNADGKPRITIKYRKGMHPVANLF